MDLVGLILAGGKGTRLRPITYATPKHLLPVYNKPLIYYSLYKFKINNIKNIGIVVNKLHFDKFKEILGDGKKFGLEINYILEEETLGVINAVSLAYEKFGKINLAVIFGDNIFEDDLSELFEEYKNQEFEINGEKLKGAKVALKEVKDPERFGICKIDESGKIINLVEKPKNPKSNLALTGIFFADKRYYEFFKKMKPSKRGEYEFPDFLKFYLKEESLTYNIIKGAWFDTGTFDSLLDASNFVKNHEILSKDFF